MRSIHEYLLKQTKVMSKSRTEFVSLRCEKGKRPKKPNFHAKGVVQTRFYSEGRFPFSSLKRIRSGPFNFTLVKPMLGAWLRRVPTML